MAPATGGSETILLVEDDALVRDLVRTVLRNEGYTILEAAHGHEALAIAQQHPGLIDLLLTDVVLPQMSGRELVELLSQVRRQIRVLFMSGYTDDAVMRHGLLMARVDLLPKPFSPLKLGDRQQIAWSLLTMSGVAILREDAAGAEALIEQGMALNPESHDWIGWSLNHMGHAAQLRGEYGRADQLHHRTLAVFIERLSDKSTGVMWAYQGLGETALGQGDPATALQWLRAGLNLSRELGAQIMIAWCLAGLGSVATLDEAPERAARLWGAAEHLRVTLGCRPAPAARAIYERLLGQARAQIGESAFAAAWVAGEGLSLERAIAEALGDD